MDCPLCKVEMVQGVSRIGPSWSALLFPFLLLARFSYEELRFDWEEDGKRRSYPFLGTFEKRAAFRCPRCAGLFLEGRPPRKLGPPLLHREGRPFVPQAPRDVEG